MTSLFPLDWSASRSGEHLSPAAERRRVSRGTADQQDDFTAASDN
jgi:hypothetical protein